MNAPPVLPQDLRLFDAMGYHGKKAPDELLGSHITIQSTG